MSGPRDLTDAELDRSLLKPVNSVGDFGLYCPVTLSPGTWHLVPVMSPDNITHWYAPRSQPSRDTGGLVQVQSMPSRLSDEYIGTLLSKRVSFLHRRKYYIKVRAKPVSRAEAARLAAGPDSADRIADSLR